MSGRNEITARDHVARAGAAAGPATRPGPVAALGAAGLVGALGFVALAVLVGLVRPGYSFIAQPVVALTEGPNGALVQAGLGLLGVLVIAFAAGLHLGIAPSRSGAVGPALLAVAGIGPVLAGLTGPVPPHFVLTFGGAVAGFVVLSRRMAGDPRWRGLAGYTLSTAIALLVVLPIHSALALPDGAQLHAWWGLLNWTALVLWLACVAALALRLVRVARS